MSFFLPVIPFIGSATVSRAAISITSREMGVGARSCSPLTSSAKMLAVTMRPLPRRILIIRHAEKPAPKDPPDTGLTPRGVQRANALAMVISARYPHIDYLFSSASTRTSMREVLTLKPLARKLGLPIDSSYANTSYNQLAQSLLTDPRYAGKTILICWNHRQIPQFAQALGASPPVSPWPGNLYDRIWQIDYGADGTVTIQNLPENALPGDSPN